MDENFHWNLLCQCTVLIVDNEVQISCLCYISPFAYLRHHFKKKKRGIYLSIYRYRNFLLTNICIDISSIKRALVKHLYWCRFKSDSCWLGLQLDSSSFWFYICLCSYGFYSKIWDSDRSHTTIFTVTDTLHIVELLWQTESTIQANMCWTRYLVVSGFPLHAHTYSN